MDRFNPPPWAWLLLLAGLAFFLTLAHWQYQRGQAREALRAQRLAASQQAPAPLPAQPLPGQRYRVAGRWLEERSLLHDNQSHRRRPGYHVWTAIDPGQGRPLVVVNRGWVAAPPRREQLPALPLTEPGAPATGIWSKLPRPGLAVASNACADERWPRRVIYPDAQELACILDAEVLPGLLLLDPAAPNGAARSWIEPGLPPSRHYGYALQWLAFALTALALFVILNWKRRDRETG